MLNDTRHRRRLETTTGIEHEHAEIRRKIRVVRIFPNEAPLVRLVGALAIERNEQWLERRYLTFQEASGQKRSWRRWDEPTCRRSN